LEKVTFNLKVFFEEGNTATITGVWLDAILTREDYHDYSWKVRTGYPVHRVFKMADNVPQDFLRIFPVLYRRT